MTPVFDSENFKTKSRSLTLDFAASFVKSFVVTETGDVISVPELWYQTWHISSHKLLSFFHQTRDLDRSSYFQ